MNEVIETLFTLVKVLLGLAAFGWLVNIMIYYPMISKRQESREIATIAAMLFTILFLYLGGSVGRHVENEKAEMLKKESVKTLKAASELQKKSAEELQESEKTLEEAKFMSTRVTHLVNRMTEIHTHCLYKE